jgi:hypothetical protein
MAKNRIVFWKKCCGRGIAWRKLQRAMAAAGTPIDAERLAAGSPEARALGLPDAPKADMLVVDGLYIVALTGDQAVDVPRAREAIAKCVAVAK